MNTEEQQIEKLKSWWQENGTSLIFGAALGLAGFFGWKYWNERTDHNQELASDLYNKVLEVVNTADTDKNADTKASKLVEYAQAIKSQFPSSSYAAFSAFHLAKQAVEANELDKAVEELSWVTDNHSDSELIAIAKIRLARVLIAQEKSSEALQFVSMDKESAYYAMANLVKGDALLALNRHDDALNAYKEASLEQGVVARHPSLQFMIDNLSDKKVKSDDSSSKTENESNTTEKVSETNNTQVDTSKVDDSKSDLKVKDSK